jgi:hypothetical protein
MLGRSKVPNLKKLQDIRATNFTRVVGDTVSFLVGRFLPHPGR